MKVNILFFAGIREMFGVHEKYIETEESKNSPDKLLKFLIADDACWNTVSGRIEGPALKL